MGALGLALRVSTARSFAPQTVDRIRYSGVDILEAHGDERDQHGSDGGRENVARGRG